MSQQKIQELSAPNVVTSRFAAPMRLASPERERLWKGFERFINCGDDLTDYQALGHAFPDFWPVLIEHAPFHEESAADADKRLYPNDLPIGGLPRIGAGRDPSERVVRYYSGDELAGMSEEEMGRLSQRVSLAWHPVCHRLFLVYRDTVIATWSGKGRLFADFLLGITDWNVETRYDITIGPPDSVHWHESLQQAWQIIVKEFPTASRQAPNRVSATWGNGDFLLTPRNDFEAALYTLFRQSWRARVCLRCHTFFVARRPKQTFCGTACSAGSRLESKRKWWKRVGAKRRAKQRQRVSKKTLRGGKHR